MLKALGIIMLVMGLAIHTARAGMQHASSPDSLCHDDFLLPKATQYGLHPGEINRPELLLLFEHWRATPYRYGGKTEQGIDCSGFVHVVLRTVFEAELRGGSAQLYQQVQRLDRADMQEGDLVFFRIRRGQISHVGIYLSNNKFMHATTRGGVMISDLNEPYYKRYFAGAGRI
jgi:murein DD-endopeptidase / murein LD-carboxypeptidase